MPIYLEPKDVSTELENYRSVLFVCCPMCPPMSLAMQTKKPFVEVVKHGLKTEVFDDYVQSIRGPLEQRGVRTEILSMRWPLPLICLWTEGQRKRLAERARDFEAVLVFGCNSATDTIEDILKDSDCDVIQAMRMRGIAHATTKFGFPLKVGFDVHPMRKKRKAGQNEQPADDGPSATL